MQNLPFFYLAVAVTITSTDLVCLAGYTVRRFTCLKADTHSSTNRAQCRATSFTSLYSFNSQFSRTTWLRRNQNVSILDFIGVKDDGGGGDNWSC